jgi:prepilin-type N-terminal cleavage/methylation domain-containing protein/prepilin-type processing-associated H-X9-DG protein
LGFSLIEVLVVLGIIGVVLALLMPIFAMGRESARAVSCRNNMKQMGISLHVYQSTHERFPIGFIAQPGSDPLNTDPGWGWTAMLLPHLEQSGLYSGLDFRRSIVSTAMLTAGRTTLRTLVCPADRAAGEFTVTSEDGKPMGSASTTSYTGCYGAGGDIEREPGRGNGFFVRNRALQLDDFGDGLSNTIAVGERAAMLTKSTWVGAFNGAVCRITPGGPSRSRKLGQGGVQVLARIGDKPLNDPNSDPDDFFSPHPDGINFLMGDGAVRFVRFSVDRATLRAMATRNGDELLVEAKRQVSAKNP